MQLLQTEHIQLIINHLDRFVRKLNKQKLSVKIAYSLVTTKEFFLYSHIHTKTYNYAEKEK